MVGVKRKAEVVVKVVEELTMKVIKTEVWSEVEEEEGWKVWMKKDVKQEEEEEVVEEGPITRLPVEVHHLILSMLPHKALCRAMAVCRLWRAVGGRPWLRRGYRGLARVHPDHVERVLGLPRLALLASMGLHHDREEYREVALGGGEAAPRYRIYRVRRVEEGQVRRILSSPVRHLDLSSCDLTPVCPSTLAQTLARMDSLRLFSTLLTADQLSWSLRSISQSSTIQRLAISLKSLDKTKGVPPAVVAAALANVPSLTLHDLNKQLVPTQIRELVAAIGGGSRVESLNLQSADLSYVSAASVAAAFTRVRRLNIGMVTLSSEQATEVCRELKSKGSRLEELEVNTRRSALDSVTPTLLARGLARLTSLTLSFTSLTPAHLAELFQEMAKDGSRVRYLALPNTSLSDVPPATMAAALPALLSLNLRSCALAEEQAEAVLEEVGEGGLERLDLSENRLARVAPTTLARALNTVTEVQVTNCSLTAEQLEAVLEEARMETSTRYLYIEGNSTGSLSSTLLEDVARTTLVRFNRKKKSPGRKKWCPTCGRGPFSRLRQHRCQAQA